MTHKKIFDLHCHSTYSDGTLSPEEVLAHADALNIQAIAICDHDAMPPYEMLLEKRASFQTALLPGVELSCEADEENVHILGYAYNPDFQEFIDFCAKLRRARIERNKSIIEKLNNRGFLLTEEEVYGVHDSDRSSGRRHADVKGRRVFPHESLHDPSGRAEDFR